MWELVLLCQFHDCLPGSSIEMAYDESDEVSSSSTSDDSAGCGLTVSFSSMPSVFETGEAILKDVSKVLGFSEARTTSVAPRASPSTPCRGTASALIDISEDDAACGLRPRSTLGHYALSRRSEETRPGGRRFGRSPMESLS